MGSIEARSPLGPWAGRFAEASLAPARFAIREAPFLAQLNLRVEARDPDALRRAGDVLGCALPFAPNTWTAAKKGSNPLFLSAAWLGPDEWLILGQRGAGERLASELRSALRPTRHAVTDVSAARTAIDVSGAWARLVLAKGCSLDLRAPAFGPAQCAQTLLARTRVLMLCLDAEPRMRLFVGNSFADYLALWLVDAAQEAAAASGIDTDRLASRMA